MNYIYKKLFVNFIKTLLISLFFVVINYSSISAQLLAFPTAEGSGRFSTGGRGGDVYEVTNLNNSGPGSIVAAVSSGNRTIVFRISGTIELGSVVLSPKSNTTIAGQTAPGDGICLKGRISITSSNVIVRYIRVRVDAGAANSSGDAIDIHGGSNIIIDHVSASYARDETISATQDADKVTVQWCIMSEALTFENHSYGSLIRGDYGDEKTYHHNLYAHNQGRNPRPGNYTDVSIDTLGLFFDFRNNVVYNWAGSKAGYNQDKNTVSRYNFIGNAYIRGPESGSLIFRENSVVAFGYFEDNSLDGVVPDDPWSDVDFQGFTSDQIDEYKARSYVIPMEPVRTTSPEQAKTDVLTLAGANFPKRDTIDARIVNDVLNKTGHSIDSTNNQPEGGWPVLNSLPAPPDGDHDGMPNDWEEANGLDSTNSEDRNDIGEGGYTQLEIYLNELVKGYVTDVKDGVSYIPQKFVLYQNYPNPFNPSTKIGYSIPYRTKVRMDVYDVLGRKVAELVNEEKSAGKYEVRFDAGSLSSGVYIYQLSYSDNLLSKKMLLIK